MAVSAPRKIGTNGTTAPTQIKSTMRPGFFVGLTIPSEIWLITKASGDASYQLQTTLTGRILGGEVRVFADGTEDTGGTCKDLGNGLAQFTWTTSVATTLILIVYGEGSPP